MYFGIKLQSQILKGICRHNDFIINKELWKFHMCKVHRADKHNFCFSIISEIHSELEASIRNNRSQSNICYIIFIETIDNVQLIIIRIELIWNTMINTLREESSHTNVILQYTLLAAILSAICSVIQQS